MPRIHGAKRMRRVTKARRRRPISPRRCVKPLELRRHRRQGRSRRSAGGARNESSSWRTDLYRPHGQSRLVRRRRNEILGEGAKVSPLRALCARQEFTFFDCEFIYAALCTAGRSASSETKCEAQLSYSRERRSFAPGGTFE